MDNTSPDLLGTALAFHAAGIVALPVRTDGSKAPGLQTWKAYQERQPSLDELLGWFGTDATDGIGILTGAISGNLEMVELEGRAMLDGAWGQLVQLADDNGITELWNRVHWGYAEDTPSGGLHLLYRVTGGEVRRNTKLARDEQRQVLAESRGEGGFVVVAPSAGRTHPSGKAWNLYEGGIDTIAEITADERDLLWAVIGLLDREPPREQHRASLPLGETTGTRPGDEYDAKTTWAEILEPHGWTIARRMGKGHAWTRPGKSHGISATTGQAADGIDRLYVFSSSTDFEPERPYTKFAAYTLLEHHGDYSAAARALAAAGYGSGHPASVPVAQVSAPPAERPRLTVVQDTDGSSALATVAAPSGSTSIYSEDWHALRLVAAYGDRIRWCPDRGKWLTWTPTGWAWEGTHREAGTVRELAKAVVRDLPPDTPASQHRRCLSAQGITGALVQAASDPRVTVPYAELDADPWALNTPGGLVNLRDGSIRPATPGDLVTRATTASPAGSWRGGRWEAFLAETFGAADNELATYVQTLIGYSAVGLVGAHVLPFAYGSGGNGKGVTMEAVVAVLGSYATTAPARFLMAGGERHETEIARLAGARMVVASEVDDADRFDEGKVKLLTGGDSLTARFMNRDHFTFTPSHTLWLVGNHLPAVRSGGDSFWRRLRLIPFEHTVPPESRVDDLQGLLAREHGGEILTWLIEGAVRYAAHGLAEPAGVRAATADYAHDTDTVARFLEEAALLGGGEQVRTPVAAVYGAYDRWCKASGDTPLSQKALTQALRARHGIDSVKGAKGARAYVGISLLADGDEVADGPEGAWYR